MLLLLVSLVISDLYFFNLMILLNPDFNYSKILLSSSVHKLTTGRYNFVSVILNVAFLGALIAGLLDYLFVQQEQHELCYQSKHVFQTMSK